MRFERRSNAARQLVVSALLGVNATTVTAEVCAQTSKEAAELDVEQLSDLSLEQLLDIPVETASGKAEERSLAAANVFIVTRDEIERRGYRSLAEILRRVPGIYLVNDYVNYSVGVREVTGGFRGGTRIVKIMVDGFPVSFRPDLEAFLGPEFIPIEAVEKVEIAKGPLSALYGANAFLATVNVITRKPDQRRVEASGRHVVINNNSGLGGSALITQGDDKQGILLSVSMDRTDRSGLTLARTYDRQVTTTAIFRETSEHDIARPASAFGRIDYKNETLGDFRLNVGHQELDSGAEFQLNSVMTHRSRVSLYNRWAALDWQRKAGEKLTFHAHAGLSRGEPNDEYQLFLTDTTNSSFAPQFGYSAFNALVEASYEFGHWLGIDIGADIERSDEDVLFYKETLYRAEGDRQSFETIEHIDADASKSEVLTQFGAYVQLHSAPISTLRDFRITGAARADWIEFGDVKYDVQSSYRGAIAYRFSPRLTTKVIGGRAFQTPSGTLLFAHPGFGTLRNVVGSERLTQPRPLKPQVVTSIEFVATSQLFDFLSIEGSVYYQDLTDAIRFNQAGPTIVAKNSGGKKSWGAEVVANLRFGPVKPYFAVSGSEQISAEVTRDLAGITTFEGSPALYARLFGYGGVDIEVFESVLWLNCELWFVGPRGASQANYYSNDSRVYDLPAYRELDATISTGRLPLFDREYTTQFLFSAKNILDSKHFEPGFAGVDIPQPGTTVALQLKQTL